MTEGLTLGGEHALPHADDALQNGRPGTRVILLTDVTSVHLISIKVEQDGVGAGPSSGLVRPQWPRALPDE